jgi:hypothetical protein
MESGADGALAVRDALQVAEPMFHGISPAFSVILTQLE